MQNSVILITTGVVSGTRSAQRKTSVLYGAALSRVGLTGVLYTGGDPHFLAQCFDGLLLSGGGDLSPALYGRPITQPASAFDFERDTQELALIHAFCSVSKPILGICRGIQALNVFFGGTLFEDIPNHDATTHTITTAPETNTAALVGTHFQANSYHHQAVDRLGDHLCATAWASDGTLEALEHDSLPVLGVQWHPERMTAGLCADTPADHTPLFTYFTKRMPKS